MRALSLPLAASVLLGCGPSSTPKGPEPGPAAVVEETAPASPLDKLRRDYVPLASKAPAWLVQAPPRVPAENMEQLRSLVGALGQDASPTARQIAMAAQMVFFLTDLERGLGEKDCDLECLALHASAMRILAGWSQLFEMDFFKDLLDPALAMMGMQGQETELRVFLEHVLRHAGDNWKHIVLRRYEHPDASNAEAAAALVELADELSDERDYESAAALYDMAIARDSKAATPAFHLSVASNCFRALELACGSEQLKRAGAVPEKLQDMVRRVEREKEAATVVSSTADAANPTDAIAAAMALLRLGRNDEARARFEKLRASSPRDARVIAGLAELHIEEKMSFGKARKLLMDARDFDNKDEHYYELLIGTWMEEFKSMAFQPHDSDDEFFEKIDEDMRGLEVDLETYATFDRDKGQTLLFAVRAGRVLLRRQGGKASGAELRQVLDGLIPEVNAALEKQSGTYLRRLQLVLTRFDTNAERGLQVVGTAESLEGVADLHRNIKTSLLLAAGRGLADAAAALANRSDTASRDQRAALLAAVALESGKRENWKVVAELYGALAEGAQEPETRARFLNNLAVALVHLGERNEARRILALAQGESPTVAAINAAAIAETPDMARLTAVAAPDSEVSAMARVQANMWLLRLARKKLLPDKEREAMMKEHGGPVVGPRVTGERGVVLDNSFSLGFGFSTQERVTIDLGLDIAPWLILPATHRF